MSASERHRYYRFWPSAAVRGSAAMRELSEQNLMFGGLDGTVAADPKATFAPPSCAARGMDRGMGQFLPRSCPGIDIGIV